MLLERRPQEEPDKAPVTQRLKINRFSSLTGPESFPQEQLSAHFSGLEGLRNDPEMQIINTLMFILTEAFLSTQSQTVRDATSFSFLNLQHCFGGLSFMSVISDGLIQGNKTNGEPFESWCNNDFYLDLKADILLQDVLH